MDKSLLVFLILCFNSTLVQLKGEYLDFYFVPLRCFNSTLVQLKAVWKLLDLIPITVSILP